MIIIEFYFHQFNKTIIINARPCSDQSSFLWSTERLYVNKISLIKLANYKVSIVYF